MIFHLLTLLFIALKLTGVIVWPWLLVLLPSILVFTAGFIAMLIIIAVAIWEGNNNARKYRRTP